MQLENTVPKSVAFADNKAIYVFGLYDGKLLVPLPLNIRLLIIEQHETGG